MDAGSGYIQDVWYFAKGRMPAAIMYRMYGISRESVKQLLVMCRSSLVNDEDQKLSRRPDQTLVDSAHIKNGVYLRFLLCQAVAG
jgi:hypothetical protein